MRTNPQDATTKGSAEMFAGDVWLDVLHQGDQPSRLPVNSVHFAPVPGRPGTVTRSARPCT